MNSYAKLLDTMMDAVLAGDASSAPMLLREKPGFPATAQLGVYTEGYILRLREALESAYPAVVHCMGRQEFTKLADGFIAAHPSRYFNLDKYPVALADYVMKQSKDEFVCELAQLESAIHDVYQREETAAIDAGWAQRQTPETLAEAVLLPRTASCMLAFNMPVNDYLTAFRAGENPARPEAQKNWLLVLRHKNQVNRLQLEEGEYALLSLLAEGLTLAKAFDDPRLAAYVTRAEFATSLQRWLAHWVSEGVLRQP